MLACLSVVARLLSNLVQHLLVSPSSALQQQQQQQQQQQSEHSTASIVEFLYKALVFAFIEHLPWREGNGNGNEPMDAAEKQTGEQSCCCSHFVSTDGCCSIQSARRHAFDFNLDGGALQSGTSLHSFMCQRLTQLLLLNDGDNSLPVHLMVRSSVLPFLSNCIASSSTD